MSYWYGLQFSEIAEMPLEAVNAYMQKIEARKTETKLMFADVVSLPKMKKNDRASLVNSWMKYLDVQSPAQVKPASPAILKLMGIGVRHE